jgi:hypothetical protein
MLTVASGMPTGVAYVAATPPAGDGVARAVTDFDELVAWCKATIASSRDRRRSAVVITDILFNLGSAARTGVDLIAELRRHDPRTAIVAFSAISSSLITMAAYKRGADLVVSKGDPSASQHGLPMSKEWQLLSAVASLVHQRLELAAFRGPNLHNPDRQLRRMWRLLPQHAVTHHVRDEWDDTDDALRVGVLYGADSQEYEAALTRLGRRYGDR